MIPSLSMAQTSSFIIIIIIYFGASHNEDCSKRKGKIDYPESDLIIRGLD
jgi:hypothetical protein